MRGPHSARTKLYDDDCLNAMKKIEERIAAKTELRTPAAFEA